MELRGGGGRGGRDLCGTSVNSANGHLPRRVCPPAGGAHTLQKQQENQQQQQLLLLLLGLLVKQWLFVFLLFESQWLLYVTPVISAAKAASVAVGCPRFLGISLSVSFCPIGRVRALESDRCLLSVSLGLHLSGWP